MTRVPLRDRRPRARRRARRRRPHPRPCRRPATPRASRPAPASRPLRIRGGRLQEHLARVARGVRPVGARAGAITTTSTSARREQPLHRSGQGRAAEHHRAPHRAAEHAGARAGGRTRRSRSGRRERPDDGSASNGQPFASARRRASRPGVVPGDDDGRRPAAPSRPADGSGAGATAGDRSRAATCVKPDGGRLGPRRRGPGTSGSRNARLRWTGPGSPVRAPVAAASARDDRPAQVARLVRAPVGCRHVQAQPDGRTEQADLLGRSGWRRCRAARAGGRRSARRAGSPLWCASRTAGCRLATAVPEVVTTTTGRAGTVRRRVRPPTPGRARARRTPRSARRCGRAAAGPGPTGRLGPGGVRQRVGERRAAGARGEHDVLDAEGRERLDEDPGRGGCRVAPASVVVTPAIMPEPGRRRSVDATGRRASGGAAARSEQRGVGLRPRTGDRAVDAAAAVRRRGRR